MDDVVTRSQKSCRRDCRCRRRKSASGSVSREARKPLRLRVTLKRSWLCQPQQWSGGDENPTPARLLRRAGFRTDRKDSDPALAPHRS